VILPQRIQELFKKPCTVIGLGMSNRPLIQFLLSCGVQITARDKKTRDKMEAFAHELESSGVKLVLGEEYLKDLTEPVIFRSPGVNVRTPELERARAAGAVVISEMELFLELTPARVIGITGSDGKTTTTTLTGLFLKEEERKFGKRKIYVGGNIGEPLLPYVEQMTSSDIAVLELSSFQLTDMTYAPTRAAITNLSLNHQDWHTDFEDYAEAKANIFRGKGNEMLVTNAENETAVRLAKTASCPVTLFSSRKGVDEFPDFAARRIYVEDGYVTVWENGVSRQILHRDDILLQGTYNLENYMTAIGVTYGLVSPESVAAVAKSFSGVRHRVDYIATVNGVKYFDSSIDTTPTRTAAVISAFAQKPVIICGGYDKHIPFEPLAIALKRYAKVAVLTGATREMIREALDAVEGDLKVIVEPSFEDAVERARMEAVAGESVLLSPACASYDRFKNFEERGDYFRELVLKFREQAEKTGGTS
jgi:UDP-N-acetylmuramoylalanine--D-glutamate ligase